MKRKWKKQVEEESMRVGVSREGLFAVQSGVLVLIRLPVG